MRQALELVLLLAGASAIVLPFVLLLLAIL